MAKQQQSAVRRTGGGVARSGGPQNRALPEEEQVAPSVAQIADEQYRAEVRAAAASGLMYGEVMQRFGMKNLDELYAIIRPDLVQTVDVNTQELVEPEPPDDTDDEE